MNIPTSKHAEATAPPEASACVFCQIVTGTLPASLVYEDDATLAFMNLRQANPGHVLVIPRRHVATIFDLDAALAASLARAVVIVARAVRAAFDAPDLLVFQTNGALAGQEVFHVHVHLVPRRPGDGLLPLYPTLPPAEPRARLDELAARVRQARATLSP